MNKELTLEEAENIVDNMYQNRWKECGIEDGNTIHMGNLSNLKYNELESASILLLRTEIRLKKENQQLKDRINKVIEYYEANKQECVIGRNKDDKLIRDYYLPAQYSKKILEILKEDNKEVE